MVSAHRSWACALIAQLLLVLGLLSLAAARPIVSVMDSSSWNLTGTNGTRSFAGPLSLYNTVGSTAFAASGGFATVSRPYGWNASSVARATGTVMLPTGIRYWNFTSTAGGNTSSSIAGPFANGSSYTTASANVTTAFRTGFVPIVPVSTVAFTTSSYSVPASTTVMDTITLTVTASAPNSIVVVSITEAMVFEEPTTVNTSNWTAIPKMQNDTDEWTRNVTEAQTQPLQYYNVTEEHQAEHDKLVAQLAGSIVESFGVLGAGVFGANLRENFRIASSSGFRLSLGHWAGLNGVKRQAMRKILDNVDRWANEVMGMPKTEFPNPPDLRFVRLIDDTGVSPGLKVKSRFKSIGEIIRVDYSAPKFQVVEGVVIKKEPESEFLGSLGDLSPPTPPVVSPIPGAPTPPDSPVTATEV